MNLPPLITGAERLDQILQAFSPTTNPCVNLNGLSIPVMWVELFLQYYPQAVAVFEGMTEYQRREAIDLLKTLRPESWQKTILDFLTVHDLSHLTFLNALSTNECEQIILTINYWDFDSVTLLLRRTGGYFCSKICSQIWFGDYYRFFSHHIFGLFSQIEQKEAFWHLQSYITTDTVHKIIPAIKEDVDVLLKWILSASKSSHTRSTIKTLELIYNELNESQRRRLIVRSVRFYPETFLYILTVITESEAKLICRENVNRMNSFLVSDPGICRTLIPQSRGPALRTMLSRARFPLKNSYHHTYEDVFNMLKNLPVYDKEDLDCIESIPPFIFSFFDFWNGYRKEIKLVINELNEHQLRALSFGINKLNCKRLLPELENSMSPQKFSQFLSLFDASIIEPYLEAVYTNLFIALKKAEEMLQAQNTDEIIKINVQLLQFRQNPTIQTVLKLCAQKMPGVHEQANHEIERYINAIQTYLKSRKTETKEAKRTLYAELVKEGDRNIGLLDDEDLTILGIKSAAESALLEQYRNQPMLTNSWAILHKKRIFALKELEYGCMITSAEECLELYKLAVKFL